uniref:Reverse transcriptase n=1 Tax=Cacopsylla melanoneura TaxID=428564 RepID=A0A8D8TQH5_9HEMI
MFISKISNNPTKQVHTCTDLGITFSNNLSWDKQIEDIRNRSFRKLGMIIRYCKPMQDIDTILTLYRALVRSTMEYGSVLWIPKTKKDIKSIEDVQARFVRFLFQKMNGFYPKYPQNIGYRTMLEHLPIQLIETRFKESQIKLLQNALLNKIDSQYITSKIGFKIPNPKLRRDNKTLFYVPGNRHESFLKSPIVSAMKYYNDLPDKPDLFYHDIFSLPEEYSDEDE